LPTFDDPDPAFPERQRALLTDNDGLATVGSGQGYSAHAIAQNGRKAIIECRQDP